MNVYLHTSPQPAPTIKPPIWCKCGLTQWGSVQAFPRVTRRRMEEPRMPRTPRRLRMDSGEMRNWRIKSIHADFSCLCLWVKHTRCVCVYVYIYMCVYKHNHKHSFHALQRVGLSQEQYLLVSYLSGPRPPVHSAKPGETGSPPYTPQTGNRQTGAYLSSSVFREETFRALHREGFGQKIREKTLTLIFQLPQGRGGRALRAQCYGENRSIMCLYTHEVIRTNTTTSTLFTRCRELAPQGSPGPPTCLPIPSLLSSLSFSSFSSP